MICIYNICIYIFWIFVSCVSVGPSSFVRCSRAKAKQHGVVSNGGYPLRAGGAKGQGLHSALRWRLSTSTGFSIAGPPGGIALRRRVNPKQTGGWSTCGRVRHWRENYSLGGQYIDSKKGGKEKDSTKGHLSALIVSVFTSFALPFWLCVIHLAVSRGGSLQHVSYLSFWLRYWHMKDLNTKTLGFLCPGPGFWYEVTLMMPCKCSDHTTVALIKK